MFGNQIYISTSLRLFIRIKLFVMKTQIFSIGVVLLLNIMISLSVKATNYYVNYTYSASNDIFCTAVGVDAAGKGKSASTPAQTLSWLIKTSGYAFTSGDVIYVDYDNYFKTDQAITISTPGLTIQGAGSGNTVFNYNGQQKRFISLEANNITLSDFKITGYNYDTPGYGKAINIKSNVTGIKINNIQINLCNDALGDYPVEVRSGAQVDFYGGGGTCNNMSAAAGGGIRVVGASSKVTFRSYLFNGNYRANDDGTALRVDNGTVDVYNSLIELNESGDDLKGIFYILNGKVSIYDSKFTDNVFHMQSDALKGSTIFIEGGTVKITRSIIQNSATEGTSTGFAFGGGITVNNASAVVTVDSTLFQNNSSKFAHDILVYSGTVSAYECRFNSTAKQVGKTAGATFNISHCGTPTISLGGSGAALVNFAFTDNVSPSYIINPLIPDPKGSCGGTGIKICSPATYTGLSTINCPATNTTINAIGLGTFTWWTKASGGTKFHTGNSYTTSNLSADTTIYLKSSMDACDSLVPIKIISCKSCTPPTPTFTTSPGATSCPSTNITYTTDAGNTAYVWTFPGTINVDYKIISGGTATDNTVTIQWLTSGAKTVTVGYTNSGCASTTPASNTTTVSSPITATFTISPSANSCGNTNVTYTTQGGNTNYVWTFPGVLATDYTIISGGTTSDNTVTLQWLTSGNKTVTVGYTNSGCTSTTPASNTTNVTLKPSTPTIGTITQPTCTSSGSVVLNGLPAGTWTITPSTGSPVTNSGTSYTFTGLVASTTYTFTVQDSKGCTSDASVNVVMNAVPGKPTITGAASICVGSTVQLTGSGTTLSWVSSSNAVATVSNTGLVLGVSGGNVTITYTDITNCTQTASIQVDPTAVGGTATATSTNLCTNTSTTISLSGNTGTIQWQSSPDGSTSWTNIGGANSSPFTTPTLTTGTYYYRALVTSGACVATDTSNVVTISVSPTPVAGTAKATPDTICAGSNSLLKLNGSTGTIQWQESSNGTNGWVNINGATGGTTANCTTANLNTTMYYKAILSSGVCTNAESGVIAVVVIPKVTPNVVITSKNVLAGVKTVCPDDLVKFSSIITPATGIKVDSYQWNVNGAPIVGKNDSTYSKTFPFSNSGEIFTLDVVLSGSCLSVNNLTSNSIQVIVLDLAFVPSSGLDASCGKSDGTIIIKGRGKGTVTWSGGDVPVAGTLSPNPFTLKNTSPYDTLKGLGKGIYTLTITSANPVCSQTKTVNIGELGAPLDPIKFSLNKNSPICYGDNLTLSAVFDPSSPNPVDTKFIWKKDGVLLPSEVSSSINITASNKTGETAVYTLSVSDKLGLCTSSGKDTTIITISELLTPSVPNTSLTYCKNDNKKVSDLTALITNASKTITWYNLLVGGTAYNSTDVLTSGSYFAEQSEGTCKSNSRLQVDVNIIDLASPTLPGSKVQPTCTVNTGSVDLNMPSSGVWDITSTPTVGSSTTVTTTNLTTNPFTYSFAGLTANTSYTFTIKDLHGCVSPATSSVLIGPKKTPPLTPVLDGTVVYCASKTYTLDQIKFSPVPTGTVKYYNAIDAPILGSTKVVSGTTYKFTFDDGICESTLKLATTIPMDNGPILPPLVDVSATALICAVDKPTFNSLLSKSPIVIPAGYSVVISPSAAGDTIPKTTAIGSLGGITQTIYFNIINDKGCQNPAFSKLQFKINEGPSDLVLQNGIVQFCADKKPMISDLASTKVNGSGTILKWYSSEVSTNVLPDITPLTSGGTYYASLTADPGCESIIRKTVNVEVTSFGQTTLDSDNDYTFCKGIDKKVSDLVTKPYNSSNIVWMDASKIIQVSTTSLIPGTYYAAEKNGKCVSDKPQEIEVKFSSPTISISPKKLPICAIGNGSFVITGQDPTYTYQWSKDGVLLPETSSTLSGLPDDKNVKYSVIVTDTKGCVAKDTTSFTDCEPSLPPHIFTPDGNGKNDKFVLNYAGKYPKCKLLIYNRWGALVYESEIPYKDDWDGKPNVGATIGSNVLPASTYFYMIDKGDGTDPESGYVELVK